MSWVPPFANNERFPLKTNSERYSMLRIIKQTINDIHVLNNHLERSRGQYVIYQYPNDTKGGTEVSHHSY